MVAVNNKKKTRQIVDFAVLSQNRLETKKKIMESNLTLLESWGSWGKVKVLLVKETGKKTGGTENQRKIWKQTDDGTY